MTRSLSLIPRRIGRRSYPIGHDYYDVVIGELYRQPLVNTRLALARAEKGSPPSQSGLRCPPVGSHLSFHGKWGLPVRRFLFSTVTAQANTYAVLDPRLAL